MLGMIQPQSKYTKDHSIQTDYTKPVQDVYQEACEWCIKDEASLSILDVCDAPATNRIEGLPTWVPDLSKGPLKCGRESSAELI
jgi:hypothetical protein